MIVRACVRHQKIRNRRSGSRRKPRFPVRQNAEDRGRRRNLQSKRRYSQQFLRTETAAVAVKIHRMALQAGSQMRGNGYRRQKGHISCSGWAMPECSFTHRASPGIGTPSAAFVSAHGCFVVGGRSAALPAVFSDPAGNVGFSHICSRADDKQRFIHNQTSSYLNHSAFTNGISRFPK